MARFLRSQIFLAVFLSALSLIATVLVCFEISPRWVTISGLLVNAVIFGVLNFHISRLRQEHLRAQTTESERQMFSSLIQNSGDCIVISGMDRKLRYVNGAGRAMLGLGLDENIRGVDGRQFYRPEYGERMKSEVIPSALQNGQWAGEFSLKNLLTNEDIPILLNLFPLQHPLTGEHLGLGAVSRDIRDRKKLQKQLDRFFEVSLDMLGIANTDGYFIKLNPAFTEILGYTEAELCSRPAIDFIHPEDVAATIEQITAQSDGRAVLSFENRYRTKNGDYRWFSWKSFPDGSLTYGAARDITDEKKQIALMKELSQKSTAASHAKSEFLANMSHEIRTPINGVIGMTALLLDSGLNQEQLEYARDVQVSAQSLLIVINDILDFSKIEAGKLDIEKLDFDLENLIDETARSFSWAMSNKSVTFVVSCEKNAKHLFVGDPGRIRQVLNNLLSNAIKFTANGSISLDARVLQKHANSTEFLFSVADTGIGLSPAAQEKLFQAFSQGDASTARKYGGTGLGLSISKKLVEILGGQMGVESVEGQGSKFWFKLTLENSQAATLKKLSATSPKTVFTNARILVAEDNSVNQKILLAMLTKMGYTAQTVANGNEVLSLLRDQDFDLILMDCQMPECDGYAATVKIRESRTLACRNIPIIAMTANALKGDREKCLASGMDDYASKPIAMDDLFLVVEKWLLKTKHTSQSA
jgi:PAS domain S-box-containing protein